MDPRYAPQHTSPQQTHSAAIIQVAPSRQQQQTSNDMHNDGSNGQVAQQPQSQQHYSQPQKPNLAISVPLAQQQQQAHLQKLNPHPVPLQAQPVREHSLSGSYYSDDGGPGGTLQQQQQHYQQQQQQQHQMHYQQQQGHLPGSHPDDDDTGMHGMMCVDDGDEGDDSSDDDSPRENRVLTFADEHGKGLCHVHWYEPDPGEDHRVAPGGAAAAAAAQAGQRAQDQDLDGGLENAGCGGKCVIL